MRTYKKTTIEVEGLDKVECNSCGEEISLEWGGPDVNLEANFGYGSGKDGMCFSAEICEKCWDEITSKFKIAPTLVSTIWPEIVEEQNG